MERHEQLGELVCWNAYARILHCQARPGIGLPTAECQLPALGHGVNGILHQIDEHTAKGILMQIHLPQVREAL